MARTRELPELTSEFIDLAKDYVRERTVEPAKKLGRLAGFGFAAAILFVFAALFLGIAIAVGAVVLLLLVFVLGRRKGRKGSARVEVYRLG